MDDEESNVIYSVTTLDDAECASKLVEVDITFFKIVNRKIF